MALARAAKRGRIGPLCSERAASACRMHRGGGAALGMLRYSQRGPFGRVQGLQGYPILPGEGKGALPRGRVWWTGTIRAHRCCGCGVVWRRAAESASVVQRAQLQRAEWECAELALRAHQSCTTVRAPCLPPAYARAADVGRIGRPCPERAACRGVHCMSGASSRGSAAAGLLRYSQSGPRARNVTKEYKGHPSHGYGARVPQEAHGCCGCGVVPPSGRVRFGCIDTSTTIS
jgi:hypothetical protein